jgi:hypothetical protein
MEVSILYVSGHKIVTCSKFVTVFLLCFGAILVQKLNLEKSYRVWGGCGIFLLFHANMRLVL